MAITLYRNVTRFRAKTNFFMIVKKNCSSSAKTLPLCFTTSEVVQIYFCSFSHIFRVNFPHSSQLFSQIYVLIYIYWLKHNLVQLIRWILINPLCLPLLNEPICYTYVLCCLWLIDNNNHVPHEQEILLPQYALLCKFSQYCFFFACTIFSSDV